jgi:molybdopterin-guanine dinucleotide biosynthesis protein A
MAAVDRPPPHSYAAIILAGGAGRRLGGAIKPLVRVGGVPLIARVLTAVSDAYPRIVVGGPELAVALPPDVVLVREDPPGGGPVAGLAAGLAALDPAAPDPAAADLTTPGPDQVAVLAADLPFLTGTAIAALRLALGDARRGDHAGPDAAVFVDATGRPQWLCGVWRSTALRRRMSRLGEPAGRGVRELVGDLSVVTLPAPTAPAPAYVDCDTDADIQRAEDLLRGPGGGPRAPSPELADRPGHHPGHRG